MRDLEQQVRLAVEATIYVNTEVVDSRDYGPSLATNDPEGLAALITEAVLELTKAADQ